MPSTAPAETVSASLAGVQSMAVNSRVKLLAAVESVLPCKIVSGPKFVGEFSKATLVDESGMKREHLRHLRDSFL